MMLKPRKVSTVGKAANAMIAAPAVPRPTPHGETQSDSVGLIGPRREQGDHNGGKRYGKSAVRPRGNDPEKLDRADHHEGAPSVDESRPPIRHAEPSEGSAFPVSNASASSACIKPVSTLAV